MKRDIPEHSQLGHKELAAIDLSITMLQTAGFSITDVTRDDNPRQQMAEAMVDVHHPFTDLNEHDREIINQIKVLAGQLSIRTSLPELLEARGKIVQGG